MPNYDCYTSIATKRHIMKAVWNKQVIAQSDDTVVVEGNHYFPQDALNGEFFENSTNKTECPWKGTSHYFNLNVDGSINKNAAWFYPNPKDEAKEIKDRVAFWKGVVIEEG